MPEKTLKRKYEKAGFVVGDTINEPGGAHVRMTLELNENLASYLGILKADGKPIDPRWKKDTTNDGAVVVSASWKKAAAAETYAAATNTCPITDG